MDPSIHPVGWIGTHPDSEMHLFFDDTNIKAVVAYTAHHSHVSFELRSIEPTGKTRPRGMGAHTPPPIKAIVGETVGVVRDQQYAIGIQSLNAKTLGGFPVKEDDVMPMYKHLRRIGLFRYCAQVQRPSSCIAATRLSTRNTAV